MDNYILVEMAKAGYETMYDEKWEVLPKNSIDRALWLNISKAMVKSVRFPKELHSLCRDLSLIKKA